MASRRGAVVFIDCCFAAVALKSGGRAGVWHLVLEGRARLLNPDVYDQASALAALSTLKSGADPGADAGANPIDSALKPRQDSQTARVRAILLIGWVRWRRHRALR